MHVISQGNITVTLKFPLPKLIVCIRRYASLLNVNILGFNLEEDTPVNSLPPE